MTRLDHPVPRATYRLQLNKNFPFSRAAALAPYLARLGISHVYLSPILMAQPGSTHGYDTTDHTRINPELGTRAEFEAMAEEFRRNGLGIVLDFVPNHMGVGGAANPLWLDVLEHGRASRYADWFDIDWSPTEPSLRDRLLVPFLGVPYGEALKTGVLSVKYAPDDGNFAVWAHETHKLPLRRDCYPALTSGYADGEAAAAAINADTARLDTLIREQHWRIADARVAADDINYRRFFTVSELGGIRIEREVVFDHAHRLIFELIADGLVEGLRIDHIDGLADPRGYAEALRRKSPRPIYLVVEKILGPDEALQPDWGVDGTTGYEFISLVSPLLTDPGAEAPFTSFYRDFTGLHQAPERIEYTAKLRIMDNELGAELNSLAHRLRRIAAGNPDTLDLSQNTLKRALREFVAVLPVYRTYAGPSGPTGGDVAVLAFAFEQARRNRPTWNPGAFDFLEALLTGALRTEAGIDAEAAADAIRRIQQFSGPVMAKGLEDTALYRYNRLVALDEVGERPQFFTHGLDRFHEANRMRAEQMPHSMLTTSSHDTKRGEDTRARILALTGLTSRWMAFVRSATASLDLAELEGIDNNELYLFLQLLVGAMPTELSADEGGQALAMDGLRERLQGAMTKSLREARLNSDWVSPNPDYEERVAAVIDRTLSPRRDNPILALFRLIEPGIARWGADLSLIQTALKLTVPGMPDIYQGAELWEQSLVDPDNRRPVDFALRQNLLGRAVATPDIEALLPEWQSGIVKLGLIGRVLAHRAREPELFSDGSYEPLTAEGSDGERVLAFMRRMGPKTLLVVAALRPWQGPITEANLPVQSGLLFSDLLRDRSVRSDNGQLAAAELLGQLPVAVLATA